MFDWCRVGFLVVLLLMVVKFWLFGVYSWDCVVCCWSSGCCCVRVVGLLLCFM